MHKIFYYLILFCIVSFSSTPHAQVYGEGTVYKNYDKYGVDLTSGFYNISVNLGSVGAGDGVISFDLYYGQSSGHSLQARLDRREDGQNVRFSLLLGRNVETFSGLKTANKFYSDQGSGAELIKNTAENYTVNRPDGSTVYIGWPNDLTYLGGNTGLCALGYENYETQCSLVVTSINFANGSNLFYSWHAGQNCRPRTLRNGEIVEDCAQFYRLSQVSNSYRYGIDLDYVYNVDPATYSLPLSGWHDISRVKFRNYLFSSPISNGIVSRSGVSITNITDGLGRVTRITNTGNQFSIMRPGSTAGDNLVVAHNNGIVSQVIAEGVTANYARSVSGATGTVTVSYADGAQRVVVSNLSIGRPTSDRDPLGRITSYAYDASGRLSRVTEPEGNSVSYTYDTRGNITQTRTVSKTPGTPADIVTSATYPATCTNVKTCNKPTTTTDAKGGVTEYDYDAVTGQVYVVTQPSATAGGVRPQTRYGYYRDSVSGVTLLQTVSTCRTQASCSGTADETRTTLAYNANLLPATVTIAGGDGTLSATTTLGYDNVGNLASVDGPLLGAGDTTIYRYDAARQRVGVIGPDPDGGGPLRNPAQKIDYNLDGQVITQSEGVTNGQTDAAWSGFVVQRSMAATYDTLGRPVQQRILDSTGAIQALSQASYDSLGRVDCVAQRMNPATYGALPAACTLASGGSAGPDRISKTSYDLAGRVLSTTTGFGTSAAVTQSQTFTANGQVETVSDGKGNKTTYEYDGFDRLARTRYPDPVVAGVSSASDYEALTYDPNGNITTQRTRDNKTTRFSYDALNRLTLRDFDNGNTGADINYSYDLSGRLLSAYFGNGSTIGMTYDALGRLVSQANYSRTIGFQYDAAGRRTRLQYPDGFFVDYDYDLLGRTTAIRENGATSGVGVLARYAYADDGALATLTRGNGTTTAVQVDGIGRLARLTHDFAGTAQDWQASFSYTPSSQIASRSQVNDAVYAWRGHYNVNRSDTANGLNQLTTSGPLTLTYVNVSNLKSDGTWTYNYDTENKLRKVTRPGVVVQLNYDPFDRLFVTTATPGTLTKFLYDGDALIGEYDTNDQLQQRTVHGPGVDAPLVRYDAAGVRRWLHADERGSVVAESDASGQVVATYSYGPYGEPDSTAGGRLRYTGQMLIPELGLYHYRARTYSAYLGRFLQADPAGTADGLNLYAYVGNDPINATDPSGLGAIYCRPNFTLTQTYTGVAVTNAKTGEVFFNGGWDITHNVTQLICDYVAEGIGGSFPGNSTQPPPEKEETQKEKPQSVGCGTRLPNGKTVGDYVRDQRAKLQSMVDATMQSVGGPLPAATGAMAAIAWPHGPIDFKNNFRGQGDAGTLGRAGNYAYYAIGTGLIPDGMLDAGAGAYAITSALRGHKSWSTLTGPMFSDQSAASVRDAALASGGCPK